jgi:hypothetical protein
MLELAPCGHYAMLCGIARRWKMSESSSPNEVPRRRCAPSNRWIILGLLVFLHAGSAVLLGPTGTSADRFGPISANLAFGFLLAQPLVLAFWTAFAPQRFQDRILWGLLLCALLALAVEARGLFAEDRSAIGDGEFGQRGFFLSMDLILFSVATSVLLLVRRLSGWRLAQLAADPAPSQYQAYQFGIKHLLALTGIAALVFGLFRNLALVDPEASFQPIARVAGLILDIVSVFLPLSLLAWPVLGVRKHVVAAALVAILAICAFDAAYSYFFLLIWTATRADDLAHLILPMQLGGALCITVSAMIMRSCGFRMVRGEVAAALPVQ